MTVRRQLVNILKTGSNIDGCALGDTTTLADPTVVEQLKEQSEEE